VLLEVICVTQKENTHFEKEQEYDV
jgi:hypothetical protein